MLRHHHCDDAALLHAAHENLIFHIIRIIIRRLASLITKQQILTYRGAICGSQQNNRLPRGRRLSSQS